MTRHRKQALLAIAILALAAAPWLFRDRERAVQEPPGSGRGAGAAGPPARSAPLPPAPIPPGRMMRGVVQSQGVDSWTLRFTAGQLARVRVAGEGGDRLDCVVQDAAGNLLDVDADTGPCELLWVAARTGGYRLMIRNASSSAVSYHLTTN